MEAFPSLSAEELRARLECNPPFLVLDVREYPEFASGHIRGARLVPLTELEGAASTLTKDGEIVVVCKSGKRSADAGARLHALGFQNVRQLAGGMIAWEEAGSPLQREERHPWALDRQVRLCAGTLILISLVAAHWWSAAILLAWLVAGGLVFAAVTDTCGMALMLAKLPWNRPRKSQEAAQP